MSAERGLISLFGKHPAFGDFVSAGGLDADIARNLIEYCSQTLGGWRDVVGPDWQTMFDQMPNLRFWIGAGPAGGQAIRGALLPSRDRSGRRFPLAVISAPAGAAPVTEPDQAFYDIVEQELQQLRAQADFDPRAAADTLTERLPVVEEIAAVHPTFWAMNEKLAPAELLGQLAGTDFTTGQAARSYWWFAGSEARPTGFLACNGLPTVDELGWLISPAKPEQAAEFSIDDSNDVPL